MNKIIFNFENGPKRALFGGQRVQFYNFYMSKKGLWHIILKEISSYCPENYVTIVLHTPYYVLYNDRVSQNVNYIVCFYSLFYRILFIDQWKVNFSSEKANYTSILKTSSHGIFLSISQILKPLNIRKIKVCNQILQYKLMSFWSWNLRSRKNKHFLYLNFGLISYHSNCCHNLNGLKMVLLKCFKDGWFFLRRKARGCFWRFFTIESKIFFLISLESQIKGLQLEQSVYFVSSTRYT